MFVKDEAKSSISHKASKSGKQIEVDDEYYYVFFAGTRKTGLLKQAPPAKDLPRKIY
jgi:hypothetical protein